MNRVKPPTSPGEMLLHFIEEYGVSQVALASLLGWDETKVGQLVKDEEPVTAETALCLADAFGNSADFWLNCQRGWDLWHAEQSHVKRPKIS